MTFYVSYENVKFAASDVIRETLWQRLLLVEYFELKITDNQSDDFLGMLSKNDLAFPKKILGSRISLTYKRLMKILRSFENRTILEQRDIDRQQIEGVICSLQLWQARSRRASYGGASPCRHL